MKILVTGSDVKAARPKPTEAPPPNHEWAYDPAADTWSLIKTTASVNATLLSEFRDRLYPNRPQSIDVGDKVYVAATKWSGKVIRMEGDLYRVDLGDGKITSAFRQEIERLPDSAI